MRAGAFLLASSLLAATVCACGGTVQTSPDASHADDASDDRQDGQGANDPRCPAQFDSTMCGDACSPAGLTCDYQVQSGNTLWCTLRDGGPPIWTCGF
jgi:hypothetical protein